MSASIQRTEKTEEENNGGSKKMGNDRWKVSSEESNEQATTVTSNEFPKIKVKSKTELNNTVNDNITSVACSLPEYASVVIHRPIIIKVEQECTTGAVHTASVTQKESNKMTSSQNGSTSGVASTKSSVNETGNVPSETSTAASKAEECIKIKVDPLPEADVTTTATADPSIDSEAGHAITASQTQAANAIVEKIVEAATSLEHETENVTTALPDTVEAEPTTENAIAGKVAATVEYLENVTLNITPSIHTIPKPRAKAATPSLGNGTKQAAEVVLTTTYSAEPVIIKPDRLTEVDNAASVTAKSSLGNKTDHIATETKSKQATTTTTTVQADPVRIKVEHSTEDAIPKKVTATTEFSLEKDSGHAATETPTQAPNTIAQQRAAASTLYLGNEILPATVPPSVTTTAEVEPVKIKSEPSTEDATADKVTDESLGNKAAHVPTEAPIQSTNTIKEQRAEASTSSLGNETDPATDTPTITSTVETEPIIKAEPETRHVAQPLTSDESMDSTEDGEIPDPPLPDDFFEDLLKSADEIKAAAMSPPRSTNLQDNESGAAADTIPEHFFDDLLVDRVAERLADAVNDDLEIKFSEKLKELKKLEHELETETHKKSKKSKKKSHKSSHSKSRQSGERPRSRSNSSERRRHKRHRSHSRSRSKEKRIKVKSEFTSSYGSLNKVGSLFPHDIYQPESEQQEKYPTPPTISLLDDSPPSAPKRATSTSIRVKNEFSTFTPPAYEDLLQCLPVQSSAAATTVTATFSDAPTTSKRSVSAVEDTGYTGLKRIKLEKVADVAADPEEDEPQLVVTPKMKRHKAMLRAIATIKEIQHAEHSNEILSHFVYTPIVRKLPSSSSYVTQQIYENRSPLHTVNNVNFKFNSHARRFNMHEWGLEALPSWSAKIAKILCYDTNTMAAKLKAIKIPTRLQKAKKEYDDHGEEIDEVRSSFFTNAMTQTDDVTIVASGSRNRNKKSIGVQVSPNLSSFATQTDLALTNLNLSSKNDDLPLMQIINVLNENQLLALNDFAELIREPASSASDMYRLRLRMLDIYKCSQLPSALAALPSAPISNSTASNSNQPRGDYYNPQRPADPRQRPTTNSRIGDHRQLIPSDPRLAEHRQRPTSDPRLADRQRPQVDPRLAAHRQRGSVDPRLVERQPPADPRHYAAYSPQEPPPPPIYSPTPIPAPPSIIRVHSPELFNASRGSGSDDKPRFFGRGGLRR